MKFCKYCGKQIPTGETCSCRIQEEEKKDNNEELIDLGLTEAKEIEMKEPEDVEYIFCSKCGRRIPKGEICSCMEEKIVKENIGNDAVSSIKGLFSNIFKEPTKAVNTYLKNVNIKTSILIAVIFIAVVSLVETLTFISNNTVEVFGHNQLFATTMDVVYHTVKAVILDMLELALLSLMTYLFVKNVNKKDISLKDSFNIGVLTLIPQIFFVLIGLPFTLIKLYITSTITFIGRMIAVLLLGESLKAKEVEENKIFVSLISIVSITVLVINIISLIIK